MNTDNKLVFRKRNANKEGTVVHLVCYWRSVELAYMVYCNGKLSTNIIYYDNTLELSNHKTLLHEKNEDKINKEYKTMRLGIMLDLAFEIKAGCMALIASN
ncbi:MAG: hypothetical protein Barrevirus1_47 [Barrevirus sp.]|uniref:Uncharacterized protein n=1 Tax=Barrevirus sp. TaxID=2487763 RepID=A0A3G4ZPK7_9VIRU|nr:MAG: hypothetical protein Barrevirus1_47 [Barrevirus sp.]